MMKNNYTPPIINDELDNPIWSSTTLRLSCIVEDEKDVVISTRNEKKLSLSQQIPSLTSLNATIVIQSCLHNKNLISIDLSHNAIQGAVDLSNIAQSCGNSLLTLDLSYNRISSVTLMSALARFDHLKTLNLSFNELKGVPMEVLLLASNTLSVLDLSYNNIKHVSEEVVNVCCCGMNSNAIENTAAAASTKRQVKLDLTDNPIIHPPIEICNRGLQAMHRYYTAVTRDYPGYSPSASYFDAGMTVERSYMPSFVEVVQYDHTTPMATAEVVTASLNIEDETVVTPQNLSSWRKIVPAAVASSPMIKKAVTNAVLSGPELRASAMAMRKTTSATVVMPTGTAGNSMTATATVTPRKKDHPMIDRTLPRFPESPYLARSISAPAASSNDIKLPTTEDVKLNTSLKVTIVGRPQSGKSCLVHRLCKPEDKGVLPEYEATQGINIQEWKSHPIPIARPEGAGIVQRSVQLSFWDVTGKECAHAMQELFYSQSSVYIVVWDMAHKTVPDKQPILDSTSDTAIKTTSTSKANSDPFSLDYDSDESSVRYEDDVLHISDTGFNTPDKHTDTHLIEHSIDNTVQYYIDAIQHRAPGSVIIPVCTFEDQFLGLTEAARRACMLRERLVYHENHRVCALQARLDELCIDHKADNTEARALRRMLRSNSRPAFVFSGDSAFAPALRVSCTSHKGFDVLQHKLLSLVSHTTLLRGTLAVPLPKHYLLVQDQVRKLRGRYKIIEMALLVQCCCMSLEEVVDALLFLNCTGEVSYFGRKPLPFDFADAYVFLNPRWLVAATVCLLREDLTTQLRKLRQDHHLQLTHDDHDYDKNEEAAFLLASNQNHLPMLTKYETNVLWKVDPIVRKGCQRANTVPNQQQEVVVRPDLGILEYLQLLLLHYNILIPIQAPNTAPYITARRKDDRPVLLPSLYFLPSLVKCMEEEAALVFSYKCVEFWKGCLSTKFRLQDHEGSAWSVMERITANAIRDVYAAVHESHTNSKVWRSSSNTKYQYHLQVLQVHCWKGAFSFLIGVTEQALSNANAVSSFNPNMGQNPTQPVNTVTAHVEIFCHVLSIYSGNGNCSTTGGDQIIAVSAKGNVKEDGRLIWNGGYRLVLNSVTQALKQQHQHAEVVCPTCLANYPFQEAKSWQQDYITQCNKQCIPTLCCERGHSSATAFLSGEANHNRQRGSGVASSSNAVSAMGAIPDSSSVLPSPKETKVSLSYDAFDTTSAVHTDLTMNPYGTPHLNTQSSISTVTTKTVDHVSVQDLFGGVVLVGLWNGKQIERVGSGFIADRNRGLIVTAAHTVIDIEGNLDNSSFGRFYFGHEDAKIYIATSCPRQKSNSNGHDSYEQQNYPDEAVFRYRAVIVAADVGNVDACVLRIITRLDQDVPFVTDMNNDSNNWSCLQDQTETPVNRKILKSSAELVELPQYVNEYPELEESMRILGHNQEMFSANQDAIINCCADFVSGHVRQIWKKPKQSNRLLKSSDSIASASSTSTFIHQQQPVKRHDPKTWIVLHCTTVNGHSGGPCVNRQGEVVGILSYADENGFRCFVVPAKEWQQLLKSATSNSKRPILSD